MKKSGLLLLGLALGLAALEAALQAAALVLSAWTSPRTGEAGGRATILCIGESTTAPTLPTDHSWPKQLEDILRESGVRVRIVNRGLAGTNTAVLVSRLAAHIDIDRPSAVIAMMGINDSSWHGLALVNEPSGLGALSRLRLARLALYARHEIFASPPPEPEAYLRPGPAPESRLLARDISHGRWDAVFAALERQTRGGRAPDRAALLWLLKHDASEGTLFRGTQLLARLDWRTLDSEPAYLFAAGLFHSRRGRPGAGLPLLRRGLAQERERCALGAHVSILREFLSHGALRDAARLVERDLDACPGHPQLAVMANLLANTHLRAGRRAAAAELFSRAIRRSGLHARSQENATHTNYRLAAALLRRRGVAFFAMQYPGRPPAPLAAMLTGESGTRIISNERNFREALRLLPYREIFIDRFAGDFGHCTPRGDRLIAEAAARALSDAGLIPRPRGMASAP